jgi:protein-disulfide isomerase
MRKLIALAFFAALLFGCLGSAVNQGVAADGAYYRGADSPKLIIYEYSDFQCPFCQRVQPALEEVLRSYPETVQLRFKHNPVEELHPRAFSASLAAVCAGKQGKFWEMHDKLFGNQAATADADFEKFAVEIGLDAASFKSCYSSQQATDEVRADMAEAKRLGLDATPMFVMGDTVVRGSQTAAKFKQAIDSELAVRGN